MTDFEMRMLAFRQGQDDGFHDIILIDILTEAISFASNDKEYQMAYGLRGTVYERMGEKSNAVSDYKKAADYGSDAALECLGRLGINYTPQRPAPSGGSTPVKPAAPSSPVPSKQTVPIASSYTPPVKTSPEIKFNGVYASHNFEGLAVSAYIRFYEDKTVIITYSKKTAAQIKKEFDKKKKYIAIGTNYTIKGNEIRYQAKYDDGVSDYIGTITGDQILFNVTGCRIRKSEVYVFTAW